MACIRALEMGTIQCEIIWVPVLLLAGAVNLLMGNKYNVQLIQQANLKYFCHHHQVSLKKRPLLLDQHLSSKLFRGPCGREGVKY